MYERIRDDIAAGTESPEFRRSVLDSRLLVSESSRGSSRVRDIFAPPLFVLTAIVGLVVLVACANVANLMLARAASRRRETAVCLAMGAGRLRLVRQRMAEALLLGVVGGLAGLFLAKWGTSVLEALISGVLPIALDISPDRRALVFAVVTSCATAVVFGLLPAMRATRIDPFGALKRGGGVDNGIVQIPLGRTLVVTQIAVSLVLLVAAGLFVRSLVALRGHRPRIRPGDSVLHLEMTPQSVDRQPLSAETLTDSATGSC